MKRSWTLSSLVYSYVISITLFSAISYLICAPLGKKRLFCFFFIYFSLLSNLQTHFPAVTAILHFLILHCYYPDYFLLNFSVPHWFDHFHCHFFLIILLFDSPPLLNHFLLLRQDFIEILILQLQYFYHYH